jgi:glycerol-3-phosphate acyltransferase PlsX
MRIALDAMGGDYAPGPIVAGAVEAVRDREDLTVLLVGDKSRVEAELGKFPDAHLDRLPVVHASQVVGMEEKPVEALRKKRDNSISKSWALLASGEANAVVSAGNTGAMVASALMNAKMFLPGVRRPGIAAIYPSHRGPVAILDVGANLNAKPEDLHQYGIMGAIYAEHILGVHEPRVGLLNVGSEEEKGTDLIKAARELFAKGPLADRFVGYVEGRDIYEGNARVVVCDGFVGNVLLKSGEGAVDYLFSVLKQEMAKLLPTLPPEAGLGIGAGLKDIKARFEYQEFGGGPLLGLKGACLICHGSSRERAIKNALRVAGTMAEERVNAEFVAQLTAALGGDEGPSAAPK